MEKEIWTIDDIIKDYENKGLAGRSKVDFLNDVKDFILKNTRYVQWAPTNAEEHEKVIEEVKQKIEEKMKDKNFGKIDYSNPSMPTDAPKIFISEPFKTGIDLGVLKPVKYLKWEDLEFKPYTMKVKMGDNLYMLDWHYSNDDEYDNSKAVVLRALNGDWLFTLDKYFFNDLRLEVVE